MFAGCSSLDGVNCIGSEPTEASSVPVLAIVIPVVVVVLIICVVGELLVCIR